jgi:type I restriction enzyme S subunit
MKANYKPIGDYVNLVGERNKELQDLPLIGLSITKQFIPSIANTIGTDMSTYRTIYKNQFAYSAVTSRNGDKLTIALFKDLDKGLISQAYTPFEITDTNKLLPDYLMMWFSRPEFDRYARFKSHGSARELFTWDDLCETLIPVPHPDKQKEIVKEYNTIVNRIAINNQLIKKLEETAQTIYRQWFVDFEFPNENGKPYKSNGGEMVESELGEIPKGWEVGVLSNIANILMGQSPDGETYNTDNNGMIFYQGRTDFGYRFPSISTYTTKPKRKAKKGEILMSVRAPVGDLNIASEDCALGRGVASISSKIKCNSFLFYLMQDVRKQFDVANDEGTIFGSITKDAFHQIVVLEPQKEIVVDFEARVKLLDDNIKIYSSQLAILENLKSLLLSKLATIEN